MKVLSGNCWYSQYLMLKGALPSHNSGCQVSERRLWDCASFSLGLFNWLCYCRPAPGEDSKKEARLLVQKIQSFLTVSPLLFLSRDTLFTAALYGEGDLALDPSEVFPKGAHPHTLSAPPSLALLFAVVIFFTIMEFSVPSLYPCIPSIGSAGSC